MEIWIRKALFRRELRRLEGSEGASHAGIQGMIIVGRENTKYTGPEIGALRQECLSCVRNH